MSTSPDASSRDDKRRGASPANIAVAVAILLAAYVLSFGPVAAYYAARFEAKYEWHHTLFRYVYMPVQIALKHEPDTREPVSEYIELWMKIFNLK
jgi:hypothetical protein